MAGKDLKNPWSKYFTKRQQQVLLILLLIGMTLRIINAISSQFWRDEVYTFFYARDYTPSDLLLLRHGEPEHPPFYYIFLHFWQKISINPFFLRSTSLVASLLTFIYLPILARKLFPRSALYPFFLIFIFAFSKTMTSLNTTLRPYSFLFFLMVVSLTLFIGVIRPDQKHKGFPVGFSIVNSLVLFLDYSGFWLVYSYSLFWVYLLLVRSNKGSDIAIRLLKSLGLTGLIFSIWLPNFIKNSDLAFRNVRGTLGGLFAETNPIVSNLWQLSFFAGTTRIDLPKGFGLDEIILAIILLLLSFLGLVFIFAKDRKIGILLFIISVVPIVTAFVFSVFVFAIFLNRNLVIVTLIFIIGLSYSISLAFKKIPSLGIAFGIFWIINFFSGFPGIHYVDPPYDWIKVTRVLNSALEEKKILVTDDPLYIYAPISYYSLFWPTDELEIMDYKEALSSKAIDSNKGVFLITTGGASTYLEPGIEKLTEYAKQAGCVPNEYSLNYMYFAECK